MFFRYNFLFNNNKIFTRFFQLLVQGMGRNIKFSRVKYIHGLIKFNPVWSTWSRNINDSLTTKIYNHAHCKRAFDYFCLFKQEVKWTTWRISEILLQDRNYNSFIKGKCQYQCLFSISEFCHYIHIQNEHNILDKIGFMNLNVQNISKLRKIKDYTTVSP